MADHDRTIEEAGAARCPGATWSDILALDGRPVPAFMREEMTLEQARRTLGLSGRASDVDVRRAFKRLALKHHPDRNPEDSRAAERFGSAVRHLVAAGH